MYSNSRFNRVLPFPFMILTLIFLSITIVTSAKKKVDVKVYHFSEDGQKCDKKVSPEDLAFMQQAIEEWKKFDYKKALFETFLLTKKDSWWENHLPKPGIPGVSIEDRMCEELFGDLTGGVSCQLNGGILKLTTRDTLLALPVTRTYHYFAFLNEKGKLIWKRRSPSSCGLLYWCNPVLPFPCDLGGAFVASDCRSDDLVLYVLNLETGKIIFKQKTPSENDSIGLCFGSGCVTMPFYYNGLIIMRPCFARSNYLAFKYEGYSVAIIDVRPLLSKPK